MDKVKKILLIGYGKSGKSAEQYLQQQGCEIVLWADTANPLPESDGVDFAVISPGVPLPELNIPIYAEYELPFLFGGVRPKKIIAVTGTNGKTTVVNQINDMLKNAKQKSILCGNIGIPITSVIRECKKANIVLEVSSFMCEPSANRISPKIFRPNIAVITNITEDHLERHGNIAEYIKCKCEIFANQKCGDKLILNWDDINCRKIGNSLPKCRKVIWYSSAARVKGVYCENGVIYVNGKKFCDITAAEESAPHSISNILAAVAAGVTLHIKKDAIINACKHKTQAHKIEKIAEDNGTAFYDDSKATNIASVLSACKCFSLPINLIICGRTKGQNYDRLFNELPANVANIIVFGECKDEVVSSAEKNDYKTVTVAADMNEAAVNAIQLGGTPKVVLFSPGGSSFDMYENYEVRGNAFCKAVNKLINTNNIGAQ
jgi:UDP-N-acetylmuramoylalanine--D-glutamate ligase